MENTKKDDNKKIDIEKNSEVKNEATTPINVKLGNFLLTVLVVLIVGTGSLVYYLIFTARQDLDQYNELVKNIVKDENVVSENIESIKNMIDSALSTSTTNSTIANTVDAADATDRKIMNENLIVLYNGLLLDTTKMGKTELKYIDNSDKYKDKYVITYYNYESFSFKDSKLGTLSEQIYDGLIGIDNVSKIAISESYNAIPRTAKVVNAIPTIVSEKNTKIDEFDSKKAIIVDVDGNGTIYFNFSK